MKNSKCAHCVHCNEVKYGGFYCDKSGYIEDKRIDDKCRYYVDDTINPAVRHGRWINDTFCSVCNRFPLPAGVSTLSAEELTKYYSWCPYCGARMDQEVQE